MNKTRIVIFDVFGLAPFTRLMDEHTLRHIALQCSVWLRWSGGTLGEWIKHKVLASVVFEPFSASGRMKFVVSACALALTVSGLVVSSRVPDDSNGPIGKVLVLLKDLQIKISEDFESELKMYNKLACWCDKFSHTQANNIEEAHKDQCDDVHDVIVSQLSVVSLASRQLMFNHRTTKHLGGGSCL